MNKTLINILILTFITLIIIFTLMIIGNSVSQKFEIDEGYSLLKTKHLTASQFKNEMSKIKARELQLNIYAILNFIGISLSLISIIYLTKKKRQLKK